MSDFRVRSLLAIACVVLFVGWLAEDDWFALGFGLVVFLVLVATNSAVVLVFENRMRRRKARSETDE